jgi:thiol-disulfide isomerase/thioredoxin
LRSLTRIVVFTVILAFSSVPDAARAGEDALWEHITENMGILYFFRTTCPYCREQNGILERVREKGWKNFDMIDVDRMPAAAAKYGVGTVPSIWLVGNVAGEIRQAHISIGILSEAELMESILETYRAWFGPAI